MVDVADVTGAAMIGPTNLRLRHASGSEVVPPIVDRQVVRRAWRIVGPVETMLKQGKITKRCWRAWDVFETDWNAAMIQPALIARYGERAGAGGTPPSQMTFYAMDKAETRDERRSASVGRVERALDAVRVPQLKTVLLALASTDSGLEEIGRAVSRYADRGKAITAAVMSIEYALELLAQHYETIYGQSQIAP